MNGTPTGSAGNPSGSVVTVQGITGGNPIPVTSNGITGKMFGAAGNISTYAAMTDLIVLSSRTGSKKIELLYVTIEGGATAAALASLYLKLRSTLDTGGGAATPPTIGGLDSSIGGSSDANLVVYNAAPTLGAETFRVMSNGLYLIALGTPGPHELVSWDWRQPGYEAPSVHGTEQLCIGFDGTPTFAGGSLSVSLLWREV